MVMMKVIDEGQPINSLYNVAKKLIYHARKGFAANITITTKRKFSKYNFSLIEMASLRGNRTVFLLF